MTIYSTRLAEGITASGGSGVIYTAPSGKTVVIRTVCICAQAAGAGTALLYRGGSIGIVGFATTIQYQTLTQNLRQVLETGETIDFAAFGVGFSYELSGYLLTP